MRPRQPESAADEVESRLERPPEETRASTVERLQTAVVSGVNVRDATTPTVAGGPRAFTPAV